MYKWTTVLLLAVGCTSNPGTNGSSLELNAPKAAESPVALKSHGVAPPTESSPRDTLDVSGHGVVVRLVGHWFDASKATTYWEDNMASNLFVIESIEGDTSKSGQQIQLVGENVPEANEGPTELVGYFFLRQSPFGLVRGLEAHKKSQGHEFRYELMFTPLTPNQVSTGHFEPEAQLK